MDLLNNKLDQEKMETIINPKTTKEWWTRFILLAVLPFAIDSYMVATQRGHINYFLFFPFLAISAYFSLFYIAKTKIHFMFRILISLFILWCCVVLLFGGISYPYPEY